MALDGVRRKQTKMKILPSIQMHAWQSYELAKYGVLNRRGLPDSLGYNLYNDTVILLGWAHDVLTKPFFIKRTVFARQTAPRQALQEIAKAFGYRYIRGLITIEHKLTSDALAKFHRERVEFRHALEMGADAAHAANDKGQNPQAVLDVVRLFSNELLALCPWFEAVGDYCAAELLRDNVHKMWQQKK